MDWEELEAIRDEWISELNRDRGFDFDRVVELEHLYKTALAEYQSDEEEELTDEE